MKKIDREWKRKKRKQKKVYTQPLIHMQKPLQPYLWTVRNVFVFFFVIFFFFYLTPCLLYSCFLGSSFHSFFLQSSVQTNKSKKWNGINEQMNKAGISKATHNIIASQSISSLTFSHFCVSIIYFILFIYFDTGIVYNVCALPMTPYS